MRDAWLGVSAPKEGAAALQVGLRGAPQLPLVQKKPVLPVVGPVLSVAVAETPDSVVAGAAVQVFPPLVQLKV